MPRRSISSSLFLALSAMLIVVVPALPAHAAAPPHATSPVASMTCVYTKSETSGTVMTRSSKCHKFDNTYRGAKVTGTWSDYEYYNAWPHLDPSLTILLSLTDNQRDGECVSIAATKRGGPAPWTKRTQFDVCGVGETRRETLVFEGQNLAQGTLILWACEGSVCKRFWSQVIS